MTAELALARKKPFLEPYPELWKLVQDVLDEAVKAGIFDP